MIAAVDTNVLLDLVTPNATAAESSEGILTEALRAGPLVISESVYAELVSFFESAEQFESFRADVGIRLLPSTPGTLQRAGLAWQQYAAGRSAALECSACGQRRTVHSERCGSLIRVRQRMLPDFLIGAHAVVQADRLLSRDRGFVRRYFPALAVIPAPPAR